MPYQPDLTPKHETRPTREQIERRAFEIYEARGRQDGQDLEDWVLAEQELMAGANPAASGPAGRPQPPGSRTQAVLSEEPGTERHSRKR